MLAVLGCARRPVGEIPVLFLQSESLSVDKCKCIFKKITRARDEVSESSSRAPAFVLSASTALSFHDDGVQVDGVT